MPTKAEYVNWLYTRPVEFGQQMGFTLLTDLHNEWIRSMICDGPDSTLMAHRGSYKTTCVSVAFTILMITKPNTRIMFIRKTDTDVKEVVEQVGRMLMNERTQYLVQAMYGVPLVLLKNSASEIRTNLVNDTRGTPQLLGIGIGGSLTGKHYDLIFTDDIINTKDRTSRAERERTKDAYRELQNLKNRGGRIFNTLTPWHVDDAATLMPKPETYDCHQTGLMTEEQIRYVREHTTPSLFAANYELRHIPSDDVIFTDPQTGADISMVMQGQCHVDAAYYGEDFTAFTAMNVHDGKRYVYGRMWRKHVQDVTGQIVEEYKRLKLGRMYMEKNADKGYAARDFRKLGVRTVEYSETQNKFLKIVTYLKGAWPDIIFCEGTDESYINQIADFTEDSEHEDSADSLASLIQRGHFPKPYHSPFS